MNATTCLRLSLHICIVSEYVHNQFISIWACPITWIVSDDRTSGFTDFLFCPNDDVDRNPSKKRDANRIKVLFMIIYSIVMKIVRRVLGEMNVKYIPGYIIISVKFLYCFKHCHNILRRYIRQYIMDGCKNETTSF